MWQRSISGRQGGSHAKLASYGPDRGHKQTVFNNSSDDGPPAKGGRYIEHELFKSTSVNNCAVIPESVHDLTGLSLAERSKLSGGQKGKRVVFDDSGESEGDSDSETYKKFKLSDGKKGKQIVFDEAHDLSGLSQSKLCGGQKRKRIVLDNPDKSGGGSNSETSEKLKLPYGQKEKQVVFGEARNLSGLSLSEKSKVSGGQKGKQIIFDDPDESGSDSESETSDYEAEGGNGSESDEIRDDLDDYNSMSMEKLLSLQKEMGVKAFRQKVLKADKPVVRTLQKERSFKRLNKNRPSEMPLMRKRAPRMNFVEPGKKTKQKIYRDPRFDDLSGALDMGLWDERYRFLKDNRKKELEILKSELIKETRASKKEKIRSTIQRMENQEREKVRRDQERMVKSHERMEQRKALRQGKKPRFMTGREKKVLLKTMDFERLKDENKVSKHLQRREQRQAKKEKRYTSDQQM